MRFASMFGLGISCLVAACGAGDVGVFGESSVGPGAGGGAGDGGASSSSPAGPGPGAPSSSGSSGATTSSSGDGGAASAVSTGPTSSSTADVSTAVSSTAAGATCGNGVVDGTDFCDGADLDAQTCASLGFAGGALGCTGACTFDTTGCSRCGNGMLDGGEQCDDGGTAPGDGCDASCFFEGTSCDDPIDVAIDRDEVVTIATTNELGDPAPGTCIQATGPGRAFRVVPGDDGFLRVWVKRAGTTMDTSLRMGFSCNDTFVCADSYDPFAQGGDAPIAGGEVGGLAVDEGQPVFVYVEAWEADEVGDFEVEMTLTRGRCSEPVVVPIERGAETGIRMWGFNGDQESSAIGSCGGSGRDVVYQLRPEGDVTFVDEVTLDVVQSFSFNAVLHARSGSCNQIVDEVDCANSGGNGSDETIDGFDIEREPAWVFADSTGNSNGGFVLRVVPPAP